MHRKKLIDVLAVIVSIFPSPNYCWALTGGSAIQIRGLNHDAQDIDILASIDFAKRFSKSFSSNVIIPLQRSRYKNIDSLYAKYIFDSIFVEVMAEVENLDNNGNWQPHIGWEKHIEDYSLDNINIPVLTLGYEKYVSEILGLKKRVEMISEFQSQTIQNAEQKKTEERKKPRCATKCKITGI